MNTALGFRELLTKNLAGICSLSNEQVELLYAHYELLLRWNKLLNLTAITDMKAMVVRHYCESLFLGATLPKESGSVADVGSGAGFPGIPMAVLRPDCRFTLIESHQRKAVFLRESTRGYTNIAVTARRAEEIEETFDFIVSRGVRPPDIGKLIPKLAFRIALLTTGEQTCSILKTKRIRWSEPQKLPWGDDIVLLQGTHVPRET